MPATPTNVPHAGQRLCSPRPHASTTYGKLPAPLLTMAIHATTQPEGRQECLIYTPVGMPPVKRNLDS
jgi:hypothetical protein